jgi:hypothetical protein
MTPTLLPDWSRRRTLVFLALAITLVSAGRMLIHQDSSLTARLGDPDDAMRLVLVRDLLQGRGWFDQQVMRLQPPVGVFMHWSRLLDGGLTAYNLLLRTVLTPASAELFMRMTWPPLWLLPAMVAGLTITRRLGGGLALTAGAILFMLCADGYGLFAPGRIDHHNVQIAFCVMAAAAAVWSRESRIAALVAGAASGLGLAVGLEALPFYAAIGAALSLRFVLDSSHARAAAIYGLSLAAVCASAFLVQTPPHRWGVSACDALGANLVLAVAIAGLGLSATAWATRSACLTARAAALPAVGLLTAAAFLGLDPSCGAGPVTVNPSIRGWFASIDEMQPWSVIITHDFARGAALAAPGILGVLAWGWIGVNRSARGFAWALIGACLLIAIALMATANRMGCYGSWFAVPLIASAAADIAIKYGRRLLLSSIGLAALFSPPASAWAATYAHSLTEVRPVMTGRRALAPHDCLDTASFQALANEPAGVALAEPDLGPFILAATPHSAVSAPYHRMTWGISTAHSLLHMRAEEAEASVRRIGVSYVAVCKPPHALPGESLEARLGADAPPEWLQPLSPPSDALRVYRVRF